MTDRGARDGTRLLGSYLRPERGPVAVLTAVLVLGMVLPLAGPLLLGAALDGALDGKPSGTLVTLAVWYLVLTVAGDLLQLAVTWGAVSLAWRVGNRLRVDLARHALALDLAWHGEHSAGMLIERIDGDVDAIVRFSSTAVLQLLGNMVLLLGVLVVVTVLEWRAGLVLVLTTVVAVLVMLRLRSAAVPAHDQEREVNGRLIGDLEERLGGLEDLRANGAADYVLRRFEQYSARWWRVLRQASLRGDGAYAATAATFTAGSLATLALSLWLYRRGEMSLGLALALFRFAELVRQPVERVAEQLRELQKAAASARRAGRLLATEPAIIDGPGVPLPDGPLSVEIDDVGFGYEDEEDSLRGLDLRVPAGTTVGIVGRSGSGKTTLARLVLRLWDVRSGAVRLGGVDVRSTTSAELRRRVAVVTQDVELFRASVRDNLTMFATVDVRDARLVEVLHRVGLGPWLDAMPAGLGTELAGSHGLSAGEAQLLAAARVLVRDPGLVVLDEATSRLDERSEALVGAATAELLAGRTVLIVAHRLSTLEQVDRIWVLEDGVVVEDGPRVELAADPTSRYGQLLARAAVGAGVDDDRWTAPAVNVPGLEDDR